MCLDADSHAFINFSEFQKSFVRVLEIHVLKYVRANEVPNMTKTSRKAINLVGSA